MSRLHPLTPTALRAYIKPGDILLIEGRNHISGIIKYLTQSTWSHAALYVGPTAGKEAVGGEPCELVNPIWTTALFAFLCRSISNFTPAYADQLPYPPMTAKQSAITQSNELDFNTTSRIFSILRVTWCRCPSHSAGGDE